MGYTLSHLAVFTLVLALVLVGCAAQPTRSESAETEVAGDTRGDAASAESDEHTSASAAPVRGRARMWAENCMRCHNARPATYYSLREWEIAMHHMRVRGNLTAREHEGIMEFFRSSK